MKTIVRPFAFFSLFFFFGFALALPSPASAVGFRISAAGALSKYLGNNLVLVQNGVTVTSTVGTSIGGGLLGELFLIPMVSFETGGLYMPFTTKTSFSPAIVGDIETTNQNLVVPLLARFSVLPMIGIGGGIYRQFKLNNGGGGSNGFMGSLRLSVPVPSLEPFLDVRYLMGTENNSAGEKDKVLAVLLGISIGGVGK